MHVARGEGANEWGRIRWGAEWVGWMSALKNNGIIPRILVGGLSWYFEIRDDEVMGWRWIDEFVVSYGLTNEWK